MSNRKILLQLDNALVSLEDEFEINYLQQRLGVSRSDVLTAIAKVGNGRREVVAYLEKLKKQSFVSAREMSFEGVA